MRPVSLCSCPIRTKTTWSLSSERFREFGSANWSSPKSREPNGSVFQALGTVEQKASGHKKQKKKDDLIEASDKPKLVHQYATDGRFAPSWVKLEVWKRDRARCVKCETTSGLHFDHIIPYSKGGSSKDPKNVQILCGHHSLSKRDNIE
jgi:hypothetical protein